MSVFGCPRCGLVNQFIPGLSPTVACGGCGLMVSTLDGTIFSPQFIPVPNLVSCAGCRLQMTMPPGQTTARCPRCQLVFTTVPPGMAPPFQPYPPQMQCPPQPPYPPQQPSPPRQPDPPQQPSGGQRTSASLSGKGPSQRGIEVTTDLSAALRTNLDADGMFAQMRRRQGKIDIAAAAMISFLTAIMRPADRCSVTAFNKKFIPLVNLGDEDHCKAMMVYLTAICQDSTMLYDAIVLSVVQFVATANRSRPWLLIVLTDGDDTGSAKSLDEAAEALLLFTGARNNHAFIVGIGSDVKDDLMTRLADSSGSMYIPAEQASALPVLFALIALQVQQGIQVDIAAIRSEGAEAVLARVQRTQRLGFQNVDMLLLVDVSGSMTSH